MKILHVCECLPGGPASYLHEVLPYQLAAPEIDEVAVLAPDLQLPLLSDLSPRLRLIGYDQRRRGLASLTRLFLAIRTAVTTLRPDIVHLHSTIAGFAGRLAMVGRARAPRLVYCAHGWMIDPDRPQRFRWLIASGERLLSHLTDLIVNISPHETDFLIKAGFAADRMQLIVSGIADAPQLLSTAPAGGPIALLFIGRLDCQKGYDLLVAAAGLLKPEQAALTVVGEAVRGEGMAITAAPIRYTGWLQREAVVQEIASADAIVMPSRWEGLPLVALEAMRAGKPIIASDRGPFPSMIEHGITGLLVDSEVATFLYSALQRHTRVQFRRRGPNARLAYARSYSAIRMHEELLQSYQRLLSVRQPS